MHLADSSNTCSRLHTCDAGRTMTGTSTGLTASTSTSSSTRRTWRMAKRSTTSAMAASSAARTCSSRTSSARSARWRRKPSASVSDVVMRRLDSLVLTADVVRLCCVDRSDDVPSPETDALGSYDFFPVTYILPGEYAIFVEVRPRCCCVPPLAVPTADSSRVHRRSSNGARACGS